VSDPDQRELHISLGCALENLIVAADHFGYACTVSYGPHDRGLPGTVASVIVEPAPVIALRMRPAGLFEGLTSRQTIHGAFTARQIPPAIRRQIQHLPMEADVHLLLTREPATTCALGALNAEADIAELGDIAYRRELAHWVGQGVFGTSWTVSKLGQMFLPHLNNGASQAQRDEALLKATPLLGLISTASDDRTLQVKAGQLFERVCLLATVLGVDVHPMSQALQIPTLRREVGRVCGQRPLHPQQLFRIGYAPLDRPRRTPRRPVEQLIVKPGDRASDGQH
jgi:nitroreductase